MIENHLIYDALLAENREKGVLTEDLNEGARFYLANVSLRVNVFLQDDILDLFQLLEVNLRIRPVQALAH